MLAFKLFVVLFGSVIPVVFSELYNDLFGGFLVSVVLVLYSFTLV